MSTIIKCSHVDFDYCSCARVCVGLEDKLLVRHTGSIKQIEEMKCA